MPTKKLGIRHPETETAAPTITIKAATQQYQQQIIAAAATTTAMTIEAATTTLAL
jgi:hypothetical protein